MPNQTRSQQYAGISRFAAAKNTRPSSWLRNRCKMLIGRHLCNSTQKRVFLSKLPAEGGFPARNDNAHAGAWRRVREWRRRGIGSLPERRHGGWVAPSSACGLPRGTPQGSPETGYARQAGRLRYVTQASRLPRAPSRSRCAAKRTRPSSWPRNRCKMLIGRNLCNSTKKRVFLSKLPAEGGFPARNDIGRRCLAESVKSRLPATRTSSYRRTFLALENATDTSLR